MARQERTTTRQPRLNERLIERFARASLLLAWSLVRRRIEGRASGEHARQRLNNLFELLSAQLSAPSDRRATWMRVSRQLGAHAVGQSALAPSAGCSPVELD